MTMNRSQKMVLWIGIAVFVYVAWTAPSYEVRGGSRGEGYAMCPNYGPLVARLLSVSVVTGGLLLTLKDEKKE